MKLINIVVCVLELLGQTVQRLFFEVQAYSFSLNPGGLILDHHETTKIYVHFRPYVCPLTYMPGPIHTIQTSRIVESVVNVSPPPPGGGGKPSTLRSRYSSVFIILHPLFCAISFAFERSAAGGGDLGLEFGQIALIPCFLSLAPHS